MPRGSISTHVSSSQQTGSRVLVKGLQTLDSESGPNPPNRPRSRNFVLKSESWIPTLPCFGFSSLESILIHYHTSEDAKKVHQATPHPTFRRLITGVQYNFNPKRPVLRILLADIAQKKEVGWGPDSKAQFTQKAEADLHANPLMLLVSCVNTLVGNKESFHAHDICDHLHILCERGPSVPWVRHCRDYKGRTGQ